MLDDIKQRIVALCQQHWDRCGKAYLLSRLGIDLKGDRVELERATGKKLRDFISSEMNDVLRIEQWPVAPNIWGVFPRDALLTEEDIGFYFSAKSAPTPDNLTKAPRYNSRFWAAFSVPVKLGCRRYIDLQGKIRFRDLPADDPPPSGMLEIEADRVPPSDELQREIAILAQIDEWSEQHGLNKLDFTAEKVDARSAANGETRTRHYAPGGSVLHLLVETLDDGDLARISLPLDVIAKLLRRQAPH